MSDTTFVYIEPDWNVLLVDGEIVEQGHMLLPADVLRALEGTVVDNVDTVWVDDPDGRGVEQILRDVVPGYDSRTE